MFRTLLIAMTSLGTIVSISSITGWTAGKADKEKPMSDKTIEQVQEEHTSRWMAIAGVEGTAIGLCEGKPCIKIFSSVSAEQLKDKIPSSVEGHPVIIEETGTFRALDQ